jgi:dimethylargininase
MREPLGKFFAKVFEMQSPGTLDGGDICEAGDHFFIGLSARTNEAGANQLAGLLRDAGYRSTLIDITESEASVGGIESLLHLKSGLAYLGDNRLVITDALANRPDFSAYDLVRVDSTEEYAANCIRINDQVIIPSGYPNLAASLRELGYELITLDMSEFQKMDGGLSCLSLRF